MLPLLRRLAPILLITACTKAPQPTPAPATPSPSSGSTLTVEGSAFVLTTPQGEVLQGAALAGATVYLSTGNGATAPLRIRSVTPDPDVPDILRHVWEVPDGAGGWKPGCPPNAYGEQWGFPVVLPEGHPGREGPITITCVSAGVAKCARIGYRPWAKGPNGEDLARLNAACVRMVRADYCGDDVAHTKEGTTIDNYDDIGLARRGLASDPSFTFEAGWNEHGAVCVNHVRWHDLITLEQLRAQCPRLAAMPVCNEQTARAAGAIMFDTSRRNGT